MNNDTLTEQLPSQQGKPAFFISDGTGITAETLGYSLITQFEDLDFDCTTIPYIDNLEKAEEVATQLNNIAIGTQEKPLVFATLVNPCIRAVIAEAHCHFIDFFHAFLGPLEQQLGAKSSYTVGKTHSVHSPRNYNSRIEAVNFTLNTDDGINVHQYKQADIIMVGVSRTGKTPTCLYLALQFGLKAANYPITEEDLSLGRLPSSLKGFERKIYGLTIDPIRLQAIRKERLPQSRYASLAQCRNELKTVEQLLKKQRVPCINTTNLSVEEIATRIMSDLKISRQPI